MAAIRNFSDPVEEYAGIVTNWLDELSPEDKLAVLPLGFWITFRGNRKL